MIIMIFLYVAFILEHLNIYISHSSQLILVKLL